MLRVILPDMAIGVALGYLFGASVPERGVLGVLGAIAMVFGPQRLSTGRGGAITLPSNSPCWIGTVFGVASGSSSETAHAGLPPFQMCQGSVMHMGVSYGHEAR